MDKKERSEIGISKFLDELAASSTTQTANEMRTQLFAFTEVRSKLSELEQKGIQILEPDFLQRYEVELEGEYKKRATLDFVLRNENVELQLEVKFPGDTGTSLIKQDFQRYYEVLSDNAKTEEILVTWVNGDFLTLSLDLSQIQRYLSEEGKVIIEASLLTPFPEAVQHAFDKYRPDWMRALRMVLGKVPRYDSRELFVEALRNNIEKLKKTAEMRRYADRKQAIESISNSDIEALEQIFDEGQISKLTVEYIDKRLKQLGF